MKIVLLDEARCRFEAEDEWWREHRDAEELFVDEFARTLEQPSVSPGVGKRYRLTRGKLIQRARCRLREWRSRSYCGDSDSVGVTTDQSSGGSTPRR